MNRSTLLKYFHCSFSVFVNKANHKKYKLNLFQAHRAKKNSIDLYLEFEIHLLTGSEGTRRNRKCRRMTSVRS